MRYILVISLVLSVVSAATAFAGTGIALSSKDGSRIVARTVDRDDGPVKTGYVVVPRRHMHQSLTPTGENGLKYRSVYGYAGIYGGDGRFLVEGLNESGLSVGAFCSPGSVEYAPYDPGNSIRTLCDMQFVSWVLSQFSSIDQLRDALGEIVIVPAGKRPGALHWRIAEPDGKMAVLEIIAGIPHLRDAGAGIISGSDASMYSRAAVLLSAVPQHDTGLDTVTLAFHVLNNFDKPGVTRLAVVTDQTDMRIYFRTPCNRSIRCVDLMDINFNKVRHRTEALDTVALQQIEMIKIR